jgi:hypothetical protein
VVFDEEWVKIPSTPPRLQEDEGDEEDEDEGTVFLDHAPTPSLAAARIPDVNVALVATKVVPTRLERLELERVARMATAPRTGNERAHAFQADLIDDMPSLAVVILYCPAGGMLAYTLTNFTLPIGLHLNLVGRMLSGTYP